LRHDLLTPLNQIIGYCDLISGDLDGASETGSLRSINEAAKEARRVVALLDDVIRMMTETSRAVEEVEQVIDGIGTRIYAVKAQSSLEVARSIESSVEMIGYATGNLKAKLSDLVGEFRELSKYDGLADIDRIDTEIPALDSAGRSSSARILVVDDNSANRDLVVQHLTRAGHSAVEAENGVTCLEKLRSHDFDLVLLDIMMPEMDGFEVLESMTADEQLGGVPVIVLTSLDEVDAATACLQMGAEDFMSKPFDVSVLHARIGAVLGRAKRRVPVVTAADVANVEEQRFVESLSDREKEVLGLVATGRGNAEIAELLYLSRFTVIRHVSNIYEKIGSRNRSDATAFAHRHALVADAPDRARGN
jgi:DNA-binding NarL/FixJ family response regulator